MKKKIELHVNGKKHEIEADSRHTLLRVIREVLNLTGTKCGCERGECGSCTVLMDGNPVNSCLVLALEAEGSDIITIEGIAEDGELHDLQRNFIEHGAIQCGYCTPGMIVKAKGFLDSAKIINEEEVRKSISGNYCRCTGYEKIVKAILASAPRGNDYGPGLKTRKSSK
jgi:carbon-monoxide dehydrogenase small subunit